MKMEKARIKDVPQIQKLINNFADKDQMLPRALSEIYENIRDFYIVHDKDKVVACVALHVSWADIAEVKSLAVEESMHNKGLGAQLIRACRQEAINLGIPRIFCLTYSPGFFEKQGFTQVDKAELPRKIWNECYRCAKFPNCDEVALVCDQPIDATD